MKFFPAVSEVLLLSGFTYAGVSMRYWLDRFSVSVQAVRMRFRSIRSLLIIAIQNLEVQYIPICYRI
jgi:hypothetical protein